jgi:hypothetical protein
MADRLYLSYWLEGFSPLTMLRQYEKVLEAFPYSKLSGSDPVFRIHAVSFSEPVLMETAIPGPVDASAVVKIAGEFQNLDVALELNAAWDLWRNEREWKLAPAAVSIVSFGPEFERDLDDHIRISFGIEDQFLPPEDDAGGIPMVRGNVQSLLRLVHDLDERLQVARRLLWSESGENFAEKLQAAVGSGGPATWQ